MYFVLAKLILRWLASDQSDIFSISLCIILISSAQCRGLEMDKSSAYSTDNEFAEKGNDGKSFIYIRNRSGPKIDPCGTPEVTSKNSEEEFSMTTL